MGVMKICSTGASKPATKLLLVHRHQQYHAKNLFAYVTVVKFSGNIFPPFGCLLQALIQYIEPVKSLFFDIMWARA